MAILGEEDGKEYIIKKVISTQK